MFHRLGPPARLLLALALGVSIVLFTGVWIVASVGSAPAPVELGFDATYNPPDRSLIISTVSPRSPAEQAGLRPGDRILAIDGEPLLNESTQGDIWQRQQPGDRVSLTIVRPGVGEPLELHGRFRPSAEGDTTERVVTDVRAVFPVPFVVVGLAVLFLRLKDPHAWLLALLFASFVAIPNIPNDYVGVLPALRPFARGYESVFLGLLGALFYIFFTVFPVRSPMDRRAPWLKWIGLAVGTTLALAGLSRGQLRVPLPWEMPQTFHDRVAIAYELTFLSLGLVSLVWNYVGTRDVEARRRLRVMVWGAAAGITPGVVRRALQQVFGLPEASGVTGAVLLLILALFPISFAYAVVKHRVLEIPVLIRRGARYLLVQRGFTFLLTLLSIGLTLICALAIGPYLQPRLAWAAPTGIAIGAALGTMLVWGGLGVHRRVSERIDRAFFRTAYDARVILEDLADRLREANNRADVAALLTRHLEDALQPTRLVVYVEDGTGTLRTSSGGLDPGPGPLDRASPVLALVAGVATPLDLTLADNESVRDEVSRLLMPGAECLVPLAGRGGRLAGLIALGPRRSEEPYAGEDLRLLASVAAQAASALDNIRLAEEIAARLEVERRGQREMEIARDVQRKLLPDKAPVMQTLACAAQCIQARAVGGDCYDYLEFGDGLVGLVLADVSGKGVHAALLMANLQAHLRSQSSATPRDPSRVVREVNRLLFASTATEHYATLFFGVYEDARRGLRYVNCGHNPPVLLRAGGEVERLAPTAPVVGLFDPWTCSVGEVTLAPGDVLAIFSDGVTEAPAGDVEFGEERLIDQLRAVRDLEPAAIVEQILSAVQEYGGDTQYDDLTLLVARALA
jgi:phosphoserine phosphatase RsbU/P